jgi:hypothetical protein
MRSPCCLCVPPINLCMLEPVFMKLGMRIMATEPIPTAYYINPSHQSVCLHVYPLVVTKQRLGKNVTQQHKHCWVCRFMYGLCRIKEAGD